MYIVNLLSLTLLQACPSCSRNTHREHGASPLVSTQSESEPVGVFTATGAPIIKGLEQIQMYDKIKVK